MKIWNFPDSQTGYSMFGAFLFGFLEGSSFWGGVVWFWAFCLVGWFWIFLVSLVYWFFPNRGMKPWGLILVKRNVSQNLKKRPEFQKVCSSMETNKLLVSFHPPADIKVIFFSLYNTSATEIEPILSGIFSRKQSRNTGISKLSSSTLWAVVVSGATPVVGEVSI